MRSCLRAILITLLLILLSAVLLGYLQLYLLTTSWGSHHSLGVSLACFLLWLCVNVVLSWLCWPKAAP